MDRKNNNSSGGEGRLPALAPLANPYVPFQLENPPRYEAPMGLVRGTLFPGLDLPFRGMVNQKELPEMPLAELQALGFAVQELALDLYRSYQQLYRRSREAYSRKHGPLNHMQETEGDSYEWLDDPWPWEYSKNKEA